MATVPDQWQATLKRVLLQDPKKTSVMGVLFLVLLKVSIHALPSGDNIHPAAASGMIVVPTGASISAAPILTPPSRIGATSERFDSQLRQWLQTKVPALKRNDFLVRADAFPADPSKAVPTLSDDTLWSKLKKSLALQADQKAKQQDRINAIKAQAESIRPQSTMMGIHPRAMVNGKLLAEGEMVADFTLVKVEARGILVERDGVRFDVPMK